MRNVEFLCLKSPSFSIYMCICCSSLRVFLPLRSEEVSKLQKMCGTMLDCQLVKVWRCQDLVGAFKFPCRWNRFNRLRVYGTSVYRIMWLDGVNKAPIGDVLFFLLWVIYLTTDCWCWHLSQQPMIPGQRGRLFRAFLVTMSSQALTGVLERCDLGHPWHTEGEWRWDVGPFLLASFWTIQWSVFLMPWRWQQELQNV